MEHIIWPSAPCQRCLSGCWYVFSVISFRTPHLSSSWDAGWKCSGPWFSGCQAVHTEKKQGRLPSMNIPKFQIRVIAAETPPDLGSRLSWWWFCGSRDGGSEPGLREDYEKLQWGRGFISKYVFGFGGRCQALASMVLQMIYPKFLWTRLDPVSSVSPHMENITANKRCWSILSVTLYHNSILILFSSYSKECVYWSNC